MAVYYLRESEEPSHSLPPQTPRKGFPWTTLGVVLILISSGCGFLGLSLPSPGMMQLLGITPPASSRIRIQHLVTASPGTLKKGEGTGGISSMDLALALRGLLKLSPALVIIDGKPLPDAETAPLLAGILSEVRSRIPVLMPLEGPSTTYRPVPAVFYDPPGATPRHWPRLEGGFSNAGPGCFFPSFLPSGAGDPSELPLLADLPGGLVVGSLWWDLLVGDLPPSDRAPVWILGSRILLIGNRVPLTLTAAGGVQSPVSPPTPAAGITSGTMPLEDFLLALEREDRGLADPSFTGRWKEAVVLIAPESDSPRLAHLDSLRGVLVWKRLPLSFQILSPLLSIAALLIGRRLENRLGRHPRLAVAAALVLLSVVALLLLPRSGYLPILLPPLLAVLFLLPPLPARRADPVR